ncbi:Plasmid stabilization system protein ParE [Cruoricaptor ignavus]|uniref:Plasmid stabilization system protein ParE n=1 Tax=Cruoricaptor ignavus TaxID=1118202 RepID=A0A1M6F0I2_9FLAO|nr:type II toxin-antitoxin system RelE/ParE family toxin [Cruoricaptor ignavus]SHI91190.1 Plasmid stabilization system protein ParE [Cruoricaptor ignavus]
MDFSWKSIIRPSAYLDIEEAADYYFAIEPKLARRFIISFHKTVEKILVNPLGYEIKFSGKIRTVLVKNFPYKIYFVVMDETVVILAVLHAKSLREKRFLDL